MTVTRTQTADRFRRPALTRRQRRWRALVVTTAALSAVLVGVVVPAGCYLAYMGAPGAASWQVRTVGWLRSQGAGPVIDLAENVYYTWRTPSNRPPRRSAVPHHDQPPVTTLPPGGPVRLPVQPGRARVAGEGQWFAGRTGSNGTPLMYTAFFRPDPAHASVVAGVAWIRQSGTAAHLVAGLDQPGGHSWPGNATIPAGDRPRLVATFNSGWRMKDLPSHGGFFLAGRSGPPLVPGLATAAIDDHGRLMVGQWGRDLTSTAHLVAARQNLHLIVDAGRPVPGLATNAHRRWGSPKNQYQYTSRSGLGVDAAGNLIYVAGRQLTLQTLARALVDAGAVRAMELDIHSDLTFFATWQNRAGHPTPTKLLPTMGSRADRYLTPDSRDFFYLTVKPASSGNGAQ